MALLKTSDFPSIRAAIATDLDEVELPDSIIALPVFQGRAEADVLARDPLAETRTDPVEMLRVRTAAMFFCASYLVVSLPIRLKESYGTHYAVTKQEVDRADMAATLRGMANAQLDSILTPSNTQPERPTFFTVTCRTRETSAVPISSWPMPGHGPEDTTTG